MESNKLEISGRTTADPPPASYKQVPDPDTQETFKERPTSLTKSLKSNNEMDGADEQMLPKDEKSADKINIGDVKFTSNEKQNGEAKLDIGDVKSAFVGMSKEELMKFANDPFWIRLRWILFVSFWLLWLAMLGGAICIIIAAPKCAPPAPRTWYEEGPLVELSADIPIPSDDLKKLKDNQVKAIIISKVEDSYKPANDSTELISFIQKANEMELKVIIELSPTSSLQWFDKSEGKGNNYSDYYIWSNYNTNNATGSPEPPNNWLSPNSGSAWRYSGPRDEFYYAPNGAPHLNFRNQEVINEFSNIIRQWIDVGAKGIRLKGAPNLLVHEKLSDEPISNLPGPVHSDYEFYKHRGTTVDVEGIGNILFQWQQVVREYKDNNGPLMLSEDLHSFDAYLVNETLPIDLPRSSELFFSPEKLINASVIHNELTKALNMFEKRWPLWEYDENSPALPPDVLSMVVMLLPGSILVSSEAELNQELLKIRGVPSVSFGDTYLGVLGVNNVFAYLRVASGNPGYLVALNPTEFVVKVDFTTLNNVSDEVTIQVLSSNFNATQQETPNMEPNLKISAKDVKIPPKSAIILTYVPKST